MGGEYRGKAGDVYRQTCKLWDRRVSSEEQPIGTSISSVNVLSQRISVTL